MRELTHKDIEKGAVIELIYYFEPQIDAVIIQSALELDKSNEIRTIQGLYPKTRIDRECLKRAIKSLSDDILTSLPEKAGGKIEEEIKKSDKNVEQLPEPKNQGVEII